MQSAYGGRAQIIFRLIKIHLKTIYISDKRVHSACANNKAMESVPQFALWPTCNSSMDPIVTLSRKITAERSDAETPFYIIDFDDLRYKIKLWNEVLPRVRPHYGKQICEVSVHYKSSIGRAICFFTVLISLQHLFEPDAVTFKVGT